jgi:hypothetical protein
VPALLPEPPQRPRRLLGPVGLAGVGRPPQRGAQVDLLQVAVFGQPLLPELADRLQHREPGVAGRGLGPEHQRLVDQRGQAVEDVQPELGGVAYRLDGLEGPAAGEHRQPGKQSPLGVREQVVAPGDGPAQGPLPAREGPGPGGQQREAPLQAGQDLLGGQDPGAGGGRLDGQGQPVEPGGDLGHRRGVLGGQPELRPDRLGALDEQPDRLGSAEGVEVRGPPRIGQVQRRDDQLLLAPEGERGPGGDQHP